jgi:HAMP domain-containing protein
MTLQSRLLLMVSCLLFIAVFATATVLTWSARQALLGMKQFDGALIAELLARSAQFADANARDAEDALAEQMVAEATIAAHLVAAAEAGGATPEAINARLRDITARTALNEAWITDENGHAYLRTNPDVDFTFSPSAEEQPQAHVFWPLLTGERSTVVQEARKREIDDRVFKYVGVAGVDKPRIVQVGYAAQFLERLRTAVGLPDLVDELVAGDKVTAIRILDPELVSLAYSALPGGAAGMDLSETDRSHLQTAIAEQRTITYMDGSSLKVVAPMTGTQGRPLGATFVQLPTPFLSAATQNALVLAGLVAVCVLGLGVIASVIGSRRVSRPVATLTAAARAMEVGRFELDGLVEVAGRNDELGQLARVFERMAREVHAREQRLKEQVAELRMEVDETKKARAVAEITQTAYFQQLQQRAKELRNRRGG